MKLIDSTFILEMEWMEILSEHPENPYDKAYSSDEGVIEFEETIILDITINDEVHENVSFFEYSNITIMGFSETAVNSLYHYGILDFFDHSNNFISVSFLFKKSTNMWNELTQTSWFEDEKWKSNKVPVEEILKMLSWNNNEEIQERGIELASELKYLGYFFQPFVGEESKSLWENCAVILSKKTDEELKFYLMDCFIWLQDMNWCGAEIIANRLKVMKCTEKYEYEKRKAMRIAEIINYDEWIENLKDL